MTQSVGDVVRKPTAKENRTKQASKALDLLRSRRLSSTARLMAEYTIARFVDVVIPEGMKRTAAAIAKAKTKLTTDRPDAHPKEIEKGILAARAVLGEAFDELNPESVTMPAKVKQAA